MIVLPQLTLESVIEYEVHRHSWFTAALVRTFVPVPLRRKYYRWRHKQYLLSLCECANQELVTTKDQLIEEALS